MADFSDLPDEILLNIVRMLIPQTIKLFNPHFRRYLAEDDKVLAFGNDSTDTRRRMRAVHRLRRTSRKLRAIVDNEINATTKAVGKSVVPITLAHIRPDVWTQNIRRLELGLTFWETAALLRLRVSRLHKEDSRKWTISTIRRVEGMFRDERPSSRLTALTYKKRIGLGALGPFVSLETLYITIYLDTVLGFWGQDELENELAPTLTDPIRPPSLRQVEVWSFTDNTIHRFFRRFHNPYGRNAPRPGLIRQHEGTFNYVVPAPAHRAVIYDAASSTTSLPPVIANVQQNQANVQQGNPANAQQDGAADGDAMDIDG